MIIILEPDSEPDSKLGLIQHEKATIQLRNKNNVVQSFEPSEIVKEKYDLSILVLCSIFSK